MTIIVCKFGGTSVKDAGWIRHVRHKIVKDDPRRKAIVVSAPAGVTNLLIDWATWFDKKPGSNETAAGNLAKVQRIFASIVRDLDLGIDIAAEFETILKTCDECRRETREVYNYVVSRGEHLNGRICAEAWGYTFVDAQTFIVLDRAGRCRLPNTKRLAKRLKIGELADHGGIVVGGFYGRSRVSEHDIQLFSRGGSDITGAILGVLLDADVYENWTDVPGIYAVDPRIVDKPRRILQMTYKELRELTFMGFKVFHEDAVAFVRAAGIPIHVRSTMHPRIDGTWIRAKTLGPVRTVTGVAGKNGFTAVTIEKYGMNDQRGIQGRIERIFTKAGLSVNTTGSIDSVTVIVETTAFEKARTAIEVKLQHLRPDDIRVQNDIALICTVGEGMRNHIGISAAVSGALAKANVNIKLELQGGSEINIIRGVLEKDQATAIKALSRRFFG